MNQMKDGAIVTDTVPGSAAYDNQLMPGDIIQVLNGYYIFSTRDLAIALSSFSEEDINSYNVLGIKVNKNLETKFSNLPRTLQAFKQLQYYRKVQSYVILKRLITNPSSGYIKIYIDDFEFYVTPLINKKDIDKEKIEIYCVMYLINVEQESGKLKNFQT